MKIGLFTDLHYAKDKQYGNRYCSLSLAKLKILIDIFNNEKVDMVVNLGDTIDSSGNENEDLQNLLAVKDTFKTLNAPIYTVMGNHDLEAMSKQTFLKTLGQSAEKTYYSFMQGNILFIFLDANNNHKFQYDKGNFKWTDSYIDDEQLLWLEKQLDLNNAKNVYIFTHQNLDIRYVDGRPDPHVVKNADEVRTALNESGKTIKVFQGHDHKGYKQTIDGIDYTTLQAVSDTSNLFKIPNLIITAY